MLFRSVGRVDGDARPLSGVEGEDGGVIAIGEKTRGLERDARRSCGFVPRPENSEHEDGGH